MSGPDDVAVVWVAPDSGGRATPGDGRDDASRALTEWARARGLHIVTSDGASTSALKIDSSIADRTEKELDHAREAIAAQDVDAAERALARAEALLREHPELPQAAWLRAEVHRGWSARYSRLEPRDTERARVAWEEADALDGGRAPGIGELAAPLRARSSASLVVHGAANRKLVARLDGLELAGSTSADGVTTYPLEVPAAEHQLVITLDGDPAFASWLSIAHASAGSPRVAIPVNVGDVGSCSTSSLAGVTRDGGSVHAQGVSCEHWVAAYPSERRGTVLVARCDRNACGAFLEWRSEGGFGGGSPFAPDKPHGGSWPAWATWTAVGVGALAATTVVLIAAGVFESRPTEQRFVSGGVKVE